MEVKTLEQEQYVDIFASQGTGSAYAAPKFGAEEKSIDLFTTNQEIVKNTLENLPVEGEEGKALLQEVDLLGGQAVAPVTYDFKDAVGYFEDRFKNGKFVKVTTENEKGEEIDFIPRTPEEFDEVIDIQVNYKLDNAKQELENNWYKSKPQAWQAVAKYAEIVDNVQDLIPFIEGVKNIESVVEIDDNEIDGAEKIVRTRLIQRGESPDIIDEQVEMLKSTDKLISTAKKYKPLILNSEKAYLEELHKNAEQERQSYNRLVYEIREKAITAIESPIFGKHKMKNEEKAIVYDLIAQPDAESKGYKIYSAIDSLFEKGEFETLKKLALLISKPDSFMNYVSLDAKNSTAVSLQNKLKVAGEAVGTSKMDSSEERVKVQRGQYNAAPRFGR